MTQFGFPIWVLSTRIINTIISIHGLSTDQHWVFPIWMLRDSTDVCPKTVDEHCSQNGSGPFFQLPWYSMRKTGGIWGFSAQSFRWTHTQQIFVVVDLFSIILNHSYSKDPTESRSVASPSHWKSPWWCPRRCCLVISAWKKTYISLYVCNLSIYFIVNIYLSIHPSIHVHIYIYIHIITIYYNHVQTSVTFLEQQIARSNGRAHLFASPGGAESHGGGPDGPPTRQHAGRGGAPGMAGQRGTVLSMRKTVVNW